MLKRAAMIIAAIVVSATVAVAAPVNNGDGTITDDTFGIVWDLNSYMFLAYYQDAEAHCQSMGERLPTIDEVMALVQSGVLVNVLDPTYTGTRYVSPGSYWSSTEAPFTDGGPIYYMPDGTAKAHYVAETWGINKGYLSEKYSVLCVSDAPQATYLTVEKEGFYTAQFQNGTGVADLYVNDVLVGSFMSGTANLGYLMAGDTIRITVDGQDPETVNQIDWQSWDLFWNNGAVHIFVQDPPAPVCDVTQADLDAVNATLATCEAELASCQANALTQADVDAAYQNGYTDGYAVGQASVTCEASLADVEAAYQAGLEACEDAITAPYTANKTKVKLNVNHKRSKLVVHMKVNEAIERLTGNVKVTVVLTDDAGREVIVEGTTFLKERGKKHHHKEREHDDDDHGKKERKHNHKKCERHH